MSGDNLPAVRVETNVDLVNPVTDSWTAVLAPVVELARSICGTDFVPDSLRDNVAGTTAAIMYGRELGLPPMTALGSTHLIKGRVGVSAEILRALVLEQGHEIVVRESSGAQVVMAGRRKGTTDWTVVTWTLDDARRAKLGGDNWTKYPRQMLAARASAELCRLIFADVIHGMAALEELDGIDVPESLNLPASNGSTKVQRKRTTKSGAAPSTPSAAPGGDVVSPTASPPLPPLPGEPGYETDGGATVSPQDAATKPQPHASSSAGGSGEHADAPSDPGGPGVDGESEAPRSGEPDPPADSELSRRALLRGLHGQFNRLGFSQDDREDRLDISMAISGETIESSNDLTFEGVQKVYDTLGQLKSKADLMRLMKVIAEAPADPTRQEGQSP